MKIRSSRVHWEDWVWSGCLASIRSSLFLPSTDILKSQNCPEQIGALVGRSNVPEGAQVSRSHVTAGAGTRGHEGSEATLSGGPGDKGPGGSPSYGVEGAKMRGSHRTAGPLSTAKSQEEPGGPRRRQETGGTSGRSMAAGARVKGNVRQQATRSHRDQDHGDPRGSGSHGKAGVTPAGVSTREVSVNRSHTGTWPL